MARKAGGTVHNSPVPTPRRAAKVLLTGFEPFGGETVNPSLLVAQALDGARVGGSTVVALGLPVAYAEATDGLLRAVDALDPHLVLGLGQAAGATGLRLERVALNCSDAAMPDNTGVVLRRQPVVAGGPAAYLATLPLARLLQVLRADGHPVGLSRDAGRYVCNHVYYRLLHHAAPLGLPGGFVHLPLLPAQAAGRPGLASLGLAQQVAAVRAGLEALCDAV